jgi:hypothetical protein
MHTHTHTRTRVQAGGRWGASTRTTSWPGASQRSVQDDWGIGVRGCSESILLPRHMTITRAGIVDPSLPPPLHPRLHVEREPALPTHRETRSIRPDRVPPCASLPSQTPPHREEERKGRPDRTTNPRSQQLTSPLPPTKTQPKPKPQPKNPTHQATGAIVASVEYRLAPEHKYPAQLEDTVDALEWLLANGGEHGIDTRRVAVAGESAGGHLTIVTGAVIGRWIGCLVGWLVE